MTDVSPAAGEKPRLLYIDDDAGLARLVQKDLQRHGVLVDVAHDGAEGLRRLAETRYDAVALDHYMPERDGLDVLPDIQALPDPPPVIYVTGAQEGRIAVAALKAGAADYVIKDVSTDFPALLRAAVEQALASERLRKAAVAAEEEMRAARDRAEALLREVNHRVGNSLQLVSSFVALQARSLSDAAAKAALSDTQARIEAVAQVHRRLYTSANVERVEMREYLTDLVEQLSQSLSAESRGVTLKLDAEPLSVETDNAVSLGVIVTELVTNAVKYAYPEDRTGEIRVRIHTTGDDAALLSVEDDGVGFGDATPAKGGGLGRMIVKAMASSLRSEVFYEGGPGARARIAFRP
jgi:two-component sensor histidine kinase/CheY-like chemotaxis protein